MKNIIYLLLLTTSFYISSQEKINDSIQGTKQFLDEVIVQTVRVKASAPFTHTNVPKLSCLPEI